MAADGRLPCFRVGRRVFFDPQEVRVWLAGQR
jgi:hypothetical protein